MNGRIVARVGVEPVVIIGLGGAGGNTVGRLKRLLRHHFAERPEVLQTLAYLVIDADRFERLDPVVREELNQTEEFLALTGTPGFVPLTLFNAFPDDSPERADLDRWFAPELRPFIPARFVDDGAARTRPLGRLYLYLKRGEALRRISDVLKRVQEASKRLPAGALGEGFRVLIVSSTCGGTGAGIFLDVLYYVNLILRGMGQHPDVETLLFLPEMFASAVQKRAPALEPFLRANAYALFRELDYIMKCPDQFNDIAMDYLSARRVENGLDRNLNEVVLLNYLVGQGIPGPGNFSDTADVYEYASRAIYHTLLAHPSGASESASDRVRSHYSNVRTIVAEMDRYREQPKRYAALGYSEIRFPRDVIESYLIARYRHAAVNLGLRGPSDSWPQKDVEETAEQLLRQIGEIRQQLRHALEGAAQTFSARVPSLEQYQIDGKLPLESIGADWVDDRRREISALISEGIRRLNVEYRGERESLTSRFRTLIEGHVDSLLDGRGTRFTRTVLERLDRRLEQVLRETLHGEDASEKRCREQSEDALRRALGDPEKGTDVVQQLRKTNWWLLRGTQAHAGRVLENFLAGLRDHVERALAAQAAHLEGELLKETAGEYGDVVAFREEYDEQGEAQRGREQQGILDRIEAQVVRVETEVCAEWLPQLAPAKVLDDRWRARGQSLTSRFLPAFDSFERLDKDGEVTRLFDHLFPGLIEKAHGEPRAREVKAILADFAQAGLSVSRIFTEITTEDARRAIDRVLVGRARARLEALDHDKSWSGLRLNQSVWERSDLTDAASSETLLREMVTLAKPACDARVLELHQDDQNGISKLWTLGIHDEKRKEQVPGQANMSIIATSPEQVSVSVVEACFPIWVVNEFRIQQDVYNARDRQRNFPHIDRRLETIIDILHPIGRVLPLETFLKARAVTHHLLEPQTANAEDRKAFLDRWRWTGRQYGASPPPFKLVYFDDGWRAVRLTVTPMEGSFDVAPSDERVEPFLRRPSRNQTVADIYAAYAQRFDVVMSHARFLEAVEQDDQSRRLLWSSCQSYRAMVQKSYEDEKRGRFEPEIEALGQFLDVLDRIIANFPGESSIQKV